MTAEDLARYQALAARWVAEENADMLVADPESPVGWSVCEPLCTTERACLLAWVREFMAGKVEPMDHYPAGVKHAVLASLVGAALGLDVVRASWLCEAAGWPERHTCGRSGWSIFSAARCMACAVDALRPGTPNTPEALASAMTEWIETKMISLGGHPASAAMVERANAAALLAGRSPSPNSAECAEIRPEDDCPGPPSPSRPA